MFLKNTYYRNWPIVVYKTLIPTLKIEFTRTTFPTSRNSQLVTVNLNINIKRSGSSSATI